MKPEMLEIVLQEILTEQKETNVVNGQLAAYVKSLTDKIDGLEKKMSKPDKSLEPDQVKLLQKLLDALEQIKSEISAKPNEVTHKRIYQLFPSMNIREYYQVYGNIFKWMALFGTACLFIRLVRDLLEKNGYL